MEALKGFWLPLAALFTVFFGIVIAIGIYEESKSICGGPRSRQEGAIQRIAATNRLQHAVFLEKQYFLSNMYEVTEGLSAYKEEVREDSDYWYWSENKGDQVLNYARSKDENKESYIGAVFKVDDPLARTEYVTISILCVSNKKEQNDLLAQLVPTVENNVISCHYDTYEL